MSEVFDTFYGRKLNDDEIGVMFINQYSGTLIRTPKFNLAFDLTELTTVARQHIKADIIVVSHEHYDHMDGVLVKKIFETGAEKVIVPPAVLSAISYLIPKDKIEVVDVGSIVEHDNLKIFVKSADHPCKTPLTMLIRTDNNFSIFHAFDTKSFNEMEEIGKSYGIDIAIIPIGIAPGVSPEDGVIAVKMLQPKLVLPHHATFGFDDFKKKVEEEVPGVKVVVLKKFQPYFIKKSDLQ